MRCCSGSRLRRRLLSVSAMLLLALPCPAALAGVIEPKEAALRLTDESYALAAEFMIDLGPRFEDAVTRGVPLFFNLEVFVERPRQYWIAEHIATRVLSYKLSYSSLTRQYRISSGGLQQNFATLPEALRLLGRIGSVPVTDRSGLKAGETYQAAVRLSLDRSQLPKPFQVDALTDKSWQVEAKTLRWTFVP
jgi:hypothetical protein